jgi:hypothetical protein
MAASEALVSMMTGQYVQSAVGNYGEIFRNIGQAVRSSSIVDESALTEGGPCTPHHCVEDRVSS